MTVKDVLDLLPLILLVLAFAYMLWQHYALKKDVALLATLKEVDDVYDALGQLLSKLDVDTVEKALFEIGLLKGERPTPQDEMAVSEWQAEVERLTNSSADSAATK